MSLAENSQQASHVELFRYMYGGDCVTMTDIVKVPADATDVCKKQATDKAKKDSFSQLPLSGYPQHGCDWRSRRQSQNRHHYSFFCASQVNGEFWWTPPHVFQCCRWAECPVSSSSKLPRSGERAGSCEVRCFFLRFFLANTVHYVDSTWVDERSMTLSYSIIISWID